MSQHTPGPWTVEDMTQQGDAALTVRSSNGLVADLVYTDRRAVETRANARLIAQAPAMLDFITYLAGGVNHFDRHEISEKARAILRAVEGDTK